MTTSGYDTKIFGEIPFWIHIFNSIRDCDSATLCGYRRKLYARTGIQVPAPIQFQCSLLDQISYYHSKIVADALIEALPTDEVKVLMNNLMVPYNLFSAPKPLIGEWINFVVPRVNKTMEIMGCPHEIDAVKEWVKTTDLIKPAENKNNSVDYQARIGGFIAERINTIFWLTRPYPKSWQNVVFLEQRAENLIIDT